MKALLAGLPFAVFALTAPLSVPAVVIEDGAQARRSAGDAQGSGTMFEDVVSPTERELATADEWVERHLGPEAERLPFSFSYGGEPSRGWLATWDVERSETELDASRLRRSLTYADPATGLQVQCEATIYVEYPAVEWVVYLENNGGEDTPILEHVRALDIVLTRPGPGEGVTVDRWLEWEGRREKATVHTELGEFVVHHAKGGGNTIHAFRPYDDELGPNGRLTIGGVSSEAHLPFFNVEWPHEGIIAGIGWTAPWRADFIRDSERSLEVQVAMTEWTAPWKIEHMKGVHFLLRPGERVRTPRVLLMFWQGDRPRAHNAWRRLLLDHYSPRPGGTLVQVPMRAATAWQSEASNIRLLDWHRDNELYVEALSMDLGWQRTATEEEAYEYLTDNVPNEKLFPNGMRALGDAIHERGIKWILWFGGSDRTRFQALYPILDRVRQHRPELLSEEYPGVDNGNPMINRYMIDFYTRVIEDWGIDVFRYDSRSRPPLDVREDRIGINWARSAEGFYEFWDALLERFPDLWFDVCGGGAVNWDLETIRRSVCLWRCDFQGKPHADPEFGRMAIATQAHTYAVSSWVPLSSGSVRELNSYAFRSAYSPGLRYTFERFSEADAPPEGPMRKEFVSQLRRKLVDEYLSVRHCFYGDYYPLTRYGLEEDAWLAWQFHRPDLGEGIVQAFRRSESAILTCQYELHGLERDATYEITSLDLPEASRITGAELSDEGLRVTITDRPGAIVIRYRKLP